MAVVDNPAVVKSCNCVCNIVIVLLRLEVPTFSEGWLFLVSVALFHYLNVVALDLDRPSILSEVACVACSFCVVVSDLLGATIAIVLSKVA